MKKNTAYTIGSLIVLLICAFCFVILPAFTGSENNQEQLPPFGKYDGKQIKYEQGSDFYNFASQYAQMFQSYGQQLDSSSYYYIFSYAFNSTVTKYAYEDAVKKSGYVAPKNAITRKLIPYFYDENGKYSSKLYKQTDDATKREIRDGVEDSIYTTRYHDDLFGSSNDLVGTNALYGIKESDAELDFLSSYGDAKRGFNMAVFSMDSYPEEEILKYGKENAAKFNKFDLSIITVEDKATANTVAKRIANGEITFEDAISEYSDKNFTNTEGKITNAYQYQVESILVNKDDLAKIADLATGSVSEIIETAGSFSIFKKNADTVAPDFDTDEVKNLVSSYLKGYENTIIEDYFTAKATDFTNQAMKSSFKDACEELGVENVEIAPFPLNYGSVAIAKSVDTSVTGLSNADTNENFLQTAFSLKKDEISSPLVMNNKIIVIQYTSDGQADEEAKTVSASDLTSYDEDSANTYILASDKLENDFANVYFNHLMSN